LSIAKFTTNGINNNCTDNNSVVVSKRRAKQCSVKRLQSFIIHPNRIVLCVQKQRNYITSSKKRRSLAANDGERKRRKIANEASISSKALVEFLNESISDIEMKKENQRLACSTKQRLSSCISHPNGTVLRVLKKSCTPALSETKKISGPRFICHPNGIVLKVLNQNRSRKSLFRAVASAQCGTVCALHRSTSLSSPLAATAAAAAAMVKMETKTNQNAEQRVKKLKRVKERANQQHYSHAHYWPP